MKPACPLILALLLLAACDSSADMPESQAAPPGVTAPVALAAAQAQPSAPAYYPAGYAEMKQAAAIFASETFGKPEESKAIAAYGNVYAIEDCQEWAENAELDQAVDRKTLALEALARRIAKHEHYLSQLYPAAVYAAALSDYERRAIEHHSLEPPPRPPEGDYESAVYLEYQEWDSRDWKLKEELAKSIEARRKELAPNAMAVEPGGGCGAGEQPYLVKTQPANGRLWVATKFAFDLCRARKLDPWDTDSCRWTELAPDKEAFLSGRYAYQARWPDGKQARGVRAFDGAPSQEGTVEVVIRRP